MLKSRIVIPEEKLADFCKRHHIRKLALFGSVVRGDFKPDSDVDVLVEFEPGHVPGLALIRMQDELSELFGGRKVDLVTPKVLIPRSGERIGAEAQVHYVQG